MEKGIYWKCLAIGIIILLLGAGSVSAIKIQTETKVVYSQMSSYDDYILGETNYDDYVLVETRNPPYQDELDDDGIFSWVHANKYTGRLEGAAMAQYDTPWSDAYGWIACQYKHDQTYNSIEKIDFIFEEFYAHIGGSLEWYSGQAKIEISYELSSEYYKKAGYIWTKIVDASPLYFYEINQPMTVTIYPDMHFQMNEQSPENIQLLIIGHVYCSANSGYASCEFNLLLSSIKIYANKPDIIVNQIWTVPGTIKKGQTINIWTEIKNDGGSAARNFVNTIYFDNVNIGSFTTSYLAPKGISTNVDSESIIYKWPYDSKTHKIKVKGDSNYLIEESNENNNEKTKSLTASISCCFPAGTKITMADGSYKNIEDVNIGDEVLSYKLDKNKFSSWTVRILSRPIHPIYNINNGLIETTSDHPFFAQKKDGTQCWTAIYPEVDAVRGLKEKVEILDVGDKLFTSDEEWIEISDISYNDEPVQTYNILSFFGKNTYFANDILVFEEFPKWQSLIDFVMEQEHPFIYVLKLLRDGSIVIFP